jgi:hypothetical protein
MARRRPQRSLWRLILAVLVVVLFLLAALVLFGLLLTLTGR